MTPRWWVFVSRRSVCGGRSNRERAGFRVSCGASCNWIWAERLPPSRRGRRWDQILQVLVAYRLIAPASEWKLHRAWFGNSAMADLLGGDFGLAEAHKLYVWTGCWRTRTHCSRI